jgi:hypothetical protein
MGPEDGGDWRRVTGRGASANVNDGIEGITPAAPLRPLASSLCPLGDAPDFRVQMPPNSDPLGGFDGSRMLTMRMAPNPEPVAEFGASCMVLGSRAATA